MSLSAQSSGPVNGGFEERDEYGLPIGWGAVIIGSESARAGALVRTVSDAHTGRGALRLKVPGDAIVGANSSAPEGSPIPLAGKVTFWYKAISSGSESSNLSFQVVPLQADGREGGAARAVFLIPKEHVGDGQWHPGSLTYNFLKTQVKSVVIAPRINESTGGRGSGEILFDDISVEKLPGILRLDAFGPARATVPRNTSFPVRVKMTNIGGDEIRNVVAFLSMPPDVKAVRNQAVTVDRLPAGDSTELVWTAQASDKGVKALSIKAEGDTGGEVAGAALIAVGFSPEGPKEIPKTAKVEESDTGITLGNRFVRLVFPKTAEGHPLYIVQLASKAGWQTLATAFPFSEVLYRAGRDREVMLPILPRQVEVKDEGPESASVVFSDTLSGPDGTVWQFRAAFDLPAGTHAVRVSYEITPDRVARVLRFSGPMLRAGEGSFGSAKSYAHFPGLEYLLEGERSSDNEGDPPNIANRYVPHPYKVTIPAMAVGHRNRLVGLMWDPLQKWDGAVIAPQPVFASPNFLEGQQSHLMGLFVPTVPDWVGENTLQGHQPYALAAGKTLSISARIVAEDGMDSYHAAGLWFRYHPFPEMPDPPRNPDYAIRFSLESYADQLWVPDAKGWRWHLPTTYKGLSDPNPSPQIATLFRAYARATDDASFRARLLEQAKAAMEAAFQGDGPLSLDHLDYAFYGGRLQETLRRAKAGLKGILSSQKEDGSWRFDYREERFQALGKKGDVAAGTCASNAWTLLRFARITGDREALEAGLKALKFLDTLKRPEGGQTWEVPLHVPDTVAAGQAIRAYLEGYRITGERRWLERAMDFGYSGLTFAYVWNAPDRPIMRFGTIPVFGSTWHSLAWYGLIVQWCGMVHGAAILELAEYDRSFPWEKMAEGEGLCGVQLQPPKGEELWGLYPDVYSPITGKVPFPVPYISPALILKILMPLRGIPVEPKSAVLHTKNDRTSITSVAKISRAIRNLEGISLTLEATPQETVQILISGSAKPRQVILGSDSLPQTNDFDQTGQGWAWDAGLKCLLIKAPLQAAKVMLKVKM